MRRDAYCKCATLVRADTSCDFEIVMDALQVMLTQFSRISAFQQGAFMILAGSAFLGLSSHSGGGALLRIILCLLSIGFFAYGARLLVP